MVYNLCPYSNGNRVGSWQHSAFAGTVNVYTGSQCNTTATLGQLNDAPNYSGTEYYHTVPIGKTGRLVYYYAVGDANSVFNVGYTSCVDSSSAVPATAAPVVQSMLQHSCA